MIFNLVLTRFEYVNRGYSLEVRDVSLCFGMTIMHLCSRSSYSLVIRIGFWFCISTYTFGASALAALSVVLESLTNRCVLFVN